MRNRFVCLLLGLMGLVCMSAKSCTEVDTPWIVNSAIFANSENDFYVSGYVTGCDCDDAGFIKHFGPSGWSTIYSAPNGAFVWDLWGASSNELFAVSDEGILHFKDGAWTTLPVGDLPCGLGSIHGSAEDSVFAVGQNGAIAFFDGNLVSLTNGGTQAGLNGVFALSKEDVFAVGDQGTILHYDGSTWSRMVP